jgi:hypothetical protein
LLDKSEFRQDVVSDSERISDPHWSHQTGQFDILRLWIVHQVRAYAPSEIIL